MNAALSAYMSRILRHEGCRAYEIHRAICRNSLADPCLTYGLVGYGYVSVQALLPFLRVQRSTMTTSSDTVNAAEATIAPTGLATATADHATSPATSASAGPIGGASRTKLRPTRPALDDEPPPSLPPSPLLLSFAIPPLS